MGHMGYKDIPKPMVPESAAGITETKGFNEAPEDEQIRRFGDLKSLFGKIKGREGRDQYSQYSDFFENIYKYPDEFAIKGLDDQGKRKIFDDAAAGNRIISKALGVFLEAKKDPERAREAMRTVMEEIISSGHHGFVDKETKRFNVDKLSGLLGWSLGAFTASGGKIGRTPPKISREEIIRMVGDLETILRQTNQYSEGRRAVEVVNRGTTADRAETAGGSSEKPKPTEIRTLQGSVYKYLPDGRTQRFKTATGELNEPMDTITFIPPWDVFREMMAKMPHPKIIDKIFDNVGGQAGYDQILLEYAQGKGKTIRVIDERGNELGSPQNLAGAEKVFLHFVDKVNPENSFTLPVSKDPTINYSTFDTRKYIDPKTGETMREQHIGNAVTEIAYEK